MAAAKAVGMIEALELHEAGGKEFVAISTSAITGNRWGGELLVFTDLDLAPSRSKAAGKVATRAACAAVGWLGPRRVVAGDDEGVVSVWDWKGDGTLDRVATLIEHDDMVSSLCVDASGAVLSASYDGTLKLWDLGAFTGGDDPVTSSATFTGHRAAVHDAAVLGGGAGGGGVGGEGGAGATVASASLDGTVRLWDSRKPFSSAAVVALGKQHGAATAVAWLPKGLLAAGAADGTLRVFDARRLDAPVSAPEQLGAGAVRTLSGGGGEGGGEVAAGTDGGWVRAYCVGSDGSLVPTVSTVPHTDSTRAVRWRPTAPGTVVSAGWDGVVATHSPAPEHAQ